MKTLDVLTLFTVFCDVSVSRNLFSKAVKCKFGAAGTEGLNTIFGSNQCRSDRIFFRTLSFPSPQPCSNVKEAEQSWPIIIEKLKMVRIFKLTWQFNLIRSEKKSESDRIEISKPDFYQGSGCCPARRSYFSCTRAMFQR